MKSPLFDTQRITANLERAYQAMWEVREMGVPASHIGESEKSSQKSCGSVLLLELTGICDLVFLSLLVMFAI